MTCFLAGLVGDKTLTSTFKRSMSFLRTLISPTLRLDPGRYSGNRGAPSTSANLFSVRATGLEPATLTWQVWCGMYAGAAGRACGSIAKVRRWRASGHVIKVITSSRGPARVERAQQLTTPGLAGISEEASAPI